MSTPSASASALPFPYPKDTAQRQANFAFSCQNIVGAVFGPQPKRWWIPAGLEYANDPANPLPNYRAPFFGAEREYEDDDHGWTVVGATRRRRRASRRYRE